MIAVTRQLLLLLLLLVTAPAAAVVSMEFVQILDAVVAVSPRRKLAATAPGAPALAQTCSAEPGRPSCVSFLLGNAAAAASMVVGRHRVSCRSHGSGHFLGLSRALWIRLEAIVGKKERWGNRSKSLLGHWLEVFGANLSNLAAKVAKVAKVAQVAHAATDKAAANKARVHEGAAAARAAGTGAARTAAAAALGATRAFAAAAAVASSHSGSLFGPRSSPQRCR